MSDSYWRQVKSSSSFILEFLVTIKRGKHKELKTDNRKNSFHENISAEFLCILFPSCLMRVCFFILLKDIGGKFYPETPSAVNGMLPDRRLVKAQSSSSLEDLNT